MREQSGMPARSYKRRRILTAGAGLGLSALAAREIYRLGAPPEGAKVCEPAYPTPAGNPAPGPELPFPVLQRGGTVDDASCLNRTPILAITAPGSVEGVRAMLDYARNRGLKITAAGARHSMGGQAFSRNGLVFDTSAWNRIEVDPATKILTVGSGAKWHDILAYLDARGLSVKAMQSISVFTVGGTLSVNAHGVAHLPGSIAPTVRSLRLMLSDGSLATASPTENAELFRHVLGGYGLFALILEAQLEVVDNELYLPNVDYMDYRRFPSYFTQRIQGRSDIGLFYGRLSVSPSSWLREAAVHSYHRVGGPQDCPPLTPDTSVRLERTVFNFSKTGAFGRWVRWNAERRFADTLDCQSRNKAIGTDAACTTSRNQQMDDRMEYLQNRLRDTDILQEYFIPQDRFGDFVDGLRAVVARERANLLNVTIRSVVPDTITALPYAPRECFALVLYFNQELSTAASQVLERTTRALIDLAVHLGGRFYLPYQLYYSATQFHAAYPEATAFFSTKRKYDPLNLLSNAFHEKYGTS